MNLIRTFAPAAVGIALTLPASAQFITIDRTVAGGNPFNTTINGSTVSFGRTSGGVNVSGLQADVIEPARFGYSDQTGGGLRVFSDSIVRVQGGTFNVSGGTGAPGGGIGLFDTSQALITGGIINTLGISGAGPGAAGARATVSGGLIQNGATQVVSVTNGTLNVLTGASISSQGAQTAARGNSGSVINISGGTITGATGAAVSIGSANTLVDSRLTVTGGTITGAAGVPSGIVIDDIVTAASITGGTISGVRANRGSGNVSPVVQVSIGGTAIINGGVAANGGAGIDVSGGSFTNYGGVNGAAFLALGTNTINFYGTDLAFSPATIGTLSYAGNTITGNYYTFTGGTFTDGQNALGLRLFDATAINGNMAPYSGGFTLSNTAASAPEPGSLALLALPLLGAIVARRRKAHSGVC